MLKLEPTASLALPPISPDNLLRKSAGGWTTKERRTNFGSRPRQTQSKSPMPAGGRRFSEGVVNEGSSRDGAPMSARGVPGERALFDMDLHMSISESIPPDKSKGQSNAGGAANAVKGRSIENWLNHTLGAAHNKPKADAGDVTAGAGNRMQGLSQFGIDAAALERLGLDSKSAERVYRAMFVYSQGLHAVLQEAVGKSKSSSQALLVLWRAFTTVLEHAGQSEEQGAESLAALVQRGNEEEKARIKHEFDTQMSTVQTQLQRVVTERRDLQFEIQRLREDELRLRNDNEMYKNDHQVAVSKYEREIKQRVDAEVRFLEKTRWADALQEDLNKERKQNMHLAMQLQDATTEREKVQVEVDHLRTQVKLQEAQAGAYKQGALEAAQQKQRHEAQVEQNKQNLARTMAKIAELKEQLEQEIEQNKKLAEEKSNMQREQRKLETQYEDESHARKELQNERDSLRERLDKMDRETSDLTDERRAMQKEINDLSMKHRTDQIELKRFSEQSERAEKALAALEEAHRKLVDAHRSLNVETEYLREDVQHFDEQLKKESELRKLLQHEKKQLTGQLQTIQIECDTSKLALQSAQKELQEVTEKMVKLEAIVRDTKSAMSKVNLEHQVELKAHTQKVAMLERVIADERNERRNLVMETQEVVEKREEAYEKLRKKDLEIQQLKHQRLEKEEESDRYRILLKAQEQRNSEQLVTVDKYHAAVASHDAEMRQMQVLLECEREEAKRQLFEIQNAYAATKHTLEQRIDAWKMCFEDVLSQLNFNPATQKIQLLELENAELKQELQKAKAFIAAEMEKVKTREAEISKRDTRIRELRTDLDNLQKRYEDLQVVCAGHVLDVERRAMGQCDAEHRAERIKQNTEAFDDMKSSLEQKIAEAHREVQRLLGLLNIPKADAEVQVFVGVSEGAAQTDLSYQYLESTSRLQDEPTRRERLAALKQASNFVDDPDARRDFRVQMRSIVPGTELRLEPGEQGARTIVSAGRPKTVSSSTTAGASSEPWPPSSRQAVSSQTSRGGSARPTQQSGARSTSMETRRSVR